LILCEFSGARRTIPRTKIGDLMIIVASLMPPGLGDDEIRGFFAIQGSTRQPFQMP
jgi:hypothetical protein